MPRMLGVRGHNLQSAPWCRFGSAVVAAESASDTLVTCRTPPSNARALQVPLVAHGEIDAAAEGPGGVSAAREHHARVRAELPLTALALSRSEPALETAYQTG